MPNPLPALVGYGVRRRVRSRGTWLLIAMGVAATAYAISGGGRAAGGSSASAGPSGVGGAGAALEVVILAAGLVAGALAASSAASLPSDAATGATSWLAATRASRPSLRAAPALAGAAVAIAASLLVVGVFGLLSLATGRRVETRLYEPAAIHGNAVVRAKEGRREGASVEIDVPAVGGGPAVLEVEARPQFRDLEAAVLHSVPLSVKGPGVDTKVPFLVKGTTRVRLDAPGVVVLAGIEARVDLRIVAASSLGPARSGALDIAMAGLLLGLGLACGAPLAVLLSRGLSPVTAAGATALLLAVGTSRDGLRSLASDAASVHGGTMAAGILRAATAIAPDLSPLSRVADVAAGRAIPAATLLLLAPALAYGLACLVAAAWLPAREGRR